VHHYHSLISFFDKRDWRNGNRLLFVDPGRGPNGSVRSLSLKLENKMSSARLFRIADKVVMTVITAALIVAVPVSAVAFVVQTL